MNKTPQRDRDAKTELILSEEKLFNKLFDIARCHCKDLRQLPDVEPRAASSEIAFLQDQRGARKMTLGDIDYEETLQISGKNGSGIKGAMMRMKLALLTLLRLSPPTSTSLTRETH